MLFISSSVVALLFLYTAAQAQPSSVWHISIDEGPAPPPDQGPPLSAHALRDKAKLRYEIIGIGGAYILWVTVSAFLILLVRGRLRRRRLLLRQSFEEEKIFFPQRVQQRTMSTTSSTTSGPISPRGAGRFTSWVSPKKGHSHHASATSVSTVDQRVLEADRAKNMDDMTKLYAAVMLQDEEKAQQAPQLSPTQRPQELQHLHYATPILDPSNRSFATTAVEEDSRTIVESRASSRKVKASPMSFLSQAHSRTDSTNSNRSRPSRISIRGQPISHPIGSPAFVDPSQYSEEAPLSPRLYTPGPAPPTPGQKSAAALAREAERGSFRKPQVPAALSFRSDATNSNGSLPFRQVYADSMKSAPATKTTFLEKRESLMHPAPKTGVPSIPYSPYQPYTPLTPITPRLVTKQDMKRNKKKRHGGGILTPDDVVPSEEEMWDSGL